MTVWQNNKEDFVFVGFSISQKHWGSFQRSEIIWEKVISYYLVSFPLVVMFCVSQPENGSCQNEQTYYLTTSLLGTNFSTNIPRNFPGK